MSVVANTTFVAAGLTLGQSALAINRSRGFIDGDRYDVTAVPDAGSVVKQPVLATEPQRQKSGGGIVPLFKGLWFNQIQVIPGRLDFGNFASPRSKTVEVWNGFFTPKRLTGVTADAASGVLVSEPESSPVIYAAQESKVYTVEVEADGAPTIDSAVTFEWLNQSIDVIVTGQRLVPWPYPMNWRQNFVETMQYKTEVLTAWDGSEQRIRYREVPRRTYEGTYVVSGRTAQRLMAVLWSWQGRNYAVPLWHQDERLTGAVPRRSTTVPVDTSSLELESGGLVGLYRSSDRFEVLVIESYTATDVTTTQGTILDWEAGDTFLPVMVARLDDSQSVNVATDRTVTLTANWRSLDLFKPEPGSSDLTYQGAPVLIDPPNWRQAPEIDFERQILEADFGWNRSFDDRYGRARTVYKFLYTLESRSKIEWYRQWINDRRGRQGSFWVPTWWDDLDLYETVQSGESTITVYSVSGETNFGDTGRDVLFITSRSGATYIRGIVGIDTDSAGLRDVISLDDTITEDLSPSDVIELGFLTKCRLDTDRIEFRHLTDTVAEVELPMRLL